MAIYGHACLLISSSLYRTDILSFDNLHNPVFVGIGACRSQWSRLLNLRTDRVGDANGVPYIGSYLMSWNEAVGTNVVLADAHLSREHRDEQNYFTRYLVFGTTSCHEPRRVAKSRTQNWNPWQRISNTRSRPFPHFISDNYQSFWGE